MLNAVNLSNKIIWGGFIMRGLSESFMSDLKQGRLNRLLQIVQKDGTLCIEIRNNYINVYYRGGSILKVSEKAPGYSIKFDLNYCVKGNTLWPQPDFSNLQTIDDYIDALPLLKREMDLWFIEKKKPEEREIQQLIIRENNMSKLANDTDYYIADIEYEKSENGSRFDLIGIKWLSDSVSRKKPESLNIAIMELKFGDSAMTNSAGIVEHFQDMEKFISTGKLGDLILEAQTQFNQKVELGLIRDTYKQIKIDTEIKPEFIILCANHKPASIVLVRELKNAKEKCNELFSKVDVRIAMANYLGYGLYARNMISIDDFINMNDM